MIRIFLAATLLACAAGAQPLRLHPQNPHYFQFNGKTLALVTSAEHYGAVLNGDFDYRKYLATLAADGMNYTRIFAGSYREVPSKSFGILRNTLAPEAGRYIAPWAQSSTPGYAAGGNKFDLDQWNPAFFDRLRDFLTEAAKHRIIVEVTLFSSHYNETHWAVSPLNPLNNVNGTDAIDWKKLHTLDNGNILKRHESYVRKIVRETNAFDNIFFEIQNEPWADRTVMVDVVNPFARPPARDQFPNSVDVGDELSRAWEARIAEWIGSEESQLPKKHLIAQNYANFRASVRGLAPGVSLANFHYAYPEAVTANYGLGIAIGYDETGFLGREDRDYLRQAWNFMLSGGSLFNHLDYSFSVGKEDGTDTEPNGPGGGSPALRRQLRLLSEFLHALPLAEMRPDPGAVKHAAGAFARVISSPGKVWEVYLDGSGPAEVRMSLPAGNYTAEWIDVRSGAVQNAEKFRHTGGDRSLTAPDFRDGIALRLRR
jgi:hypothetical protein